MQALEAAGGAEHRQLVASSDLSHGHAADAAGRLDHEFLKRVKRLDAPSVMTAVAAGAAEACGAGAVAAMSIAASKLGARNVQILVLCDAQGADAY